MAKPVLRKPKKKVCAFCKDKAQEIDYKDTGLLRKFISDRGKIRARRVTGNCRQHQRDVTVEVKDGYGRNLLLPRGLAIKATRGAEKQVAAIQRAQKTRQIRDLDHAKEVAGQLGALSLTVKAKAAGDSG